MRSDATLLQFLAPAVNAVLVVLLMRSSRVAHSYGVSSQLFRVIKNASQRLLVPLVACAITS
jgi:hypothetical protein